MARYDNNRERRIALSVEHETAETPDNQGVGEIWGSVDTPDEIDVVCLDCGAKFTTEYEPDECEVCGSSDLDVQ